MSLQDVQQILKNEGIESSLEHDGQPGVSEQLMLKYPNGNNIYLYHNMAFTSPGYSKVGIIPNKLGHIALAVKDVAKNVDFIIVYLAFIKQTKLLI